MYKTARVSGFTLIELLVTISIIAIVTGAVIPNFNAYVTNQNLLQAKEILKSDIRSIQNKALTGAYSTNLVGGVAVKHWGLRMTNGGTTYESFISATTACPVGSLAAAQYMSTSYNLPTGMTFQNSATCCLFFSFQNGDITRTCGNNPLLIGYPSGTTASINYNSVGLVF